MKSKAEVSWKQEGVLWMWMWMWTHFAPDQWYDARSCWCWGRVDVRGGGCSTTTLLGYTDALRG